VKSVEDIISHYGLILEAKELNPDGTYNFYLIKNKSGTKLAVYIQHMPINSEKGQSSIIMNEIPVQTEMVVIRFTVKIWCGL
jgi:hypothetical protein